MGYYSYFNLDASPFDGKTPLTDTCYEEIAAEIEKMNVLQDQISESEWSAYVKWYDYEADMVLLSTKFPEVLFTLSGEGDSSEDMWIEHYNNGCVQRREAQIIYPDYDKDKFEAFDDEIPEKYSYQP